MNDRPDDSGSHARVERACLPEECRLGSVAHATTAFDPEVRRLLSAEKGVRMINGHSWLRALQLAALTLTFVLSLAGTAWAHCEGGEEECDPLANCNNGGQCDCCRYAWCSGRHSSVCPSMGHDCGNHHPGTLCD